MFLIWAIPLFLFLVVVVGLILVRLRGRVRSAERTQGEILKDEE